MFSPTTPPRADVENLALRCHVSLAGRRKDLAAKEGEHNVQTRWVACRAVLPRQRGRMVYALVAAAPPKGYAFVRHTCRLRFPQDTESTIVASGLARRWRDGVTDSSP